MLRRAFPKGEVWNRLAIGASVLLAGLVVITVAGVCFVAPLIFYNTVVNDTGLEAYCRTSVGKFERMMLRPGQRADVDTYDCAIYEPRGGPYAGCLQQEGFRKTVLVSAFNPDVAEADCDVGIYPARP